MSATKHTPGPWSVGITEASNGEIEVVSASRPYVCMVLPGAIEGVTEANASLIAAAPELLEACELLLATYGELHAAHDLGECEGSIKARAAIAKAGGAQ